MLWLTLVQEQGEGDSVVVIEERPHNDVGRGGLDNLCCAGRADEAPVCADEGFMRLREVTLRQVSRCTSARHMHQHLLFVTCRRDSNTCLRRSSAFRTGVCI